MSRENLTQFVMHVGVLIIGLYAMLWLLPFIGYGQAYPTGEPVQRSFDPVLTAALSIGAAVLFAILIPYLPGQANGH